MNKGCAVDGCQGVHEGRGYCARHYQKFRKYGDPLAGMTYSPGLVCIVDGCDTKAIATGRCARHFDTHRKYGRDFVLSPDDRFWDKVDRRGPNECWEWLGSRSNGYGKIARDGRIQGAHRVALAIALGRPLVDGAHVLHSCDNPPCVNPAHLSEGTPVQNVADMDDRGRRRIAAKLTAQQVAQIRELLAAGDLTGRQIARMFGVSKATISCINVGKTWSRIS